MPGFYVRPSRDRGGEMTRKAVFPVNIYLVSRVHDEDRFNKIMRHESHCGDRRFRYHEIESLRILADSLISAGVSVRDLDGYCFGFTIPRIGKEFDLLKITRAGLINIELKSQDVGEEKIRDQLRKNRLYLSHLGRRSVLYCVVTDTLSCFRLSLTGELVRSDLDEIARSVKKYSAEFEKDFSGLFRASDYLVSPVLTPDKFIQGQYFLTQAQEQVKRQVLESVDRAVKGAFFHITGQPGTGKTLLLYDLARTLSGYGRTVIIHTGSLYDGQRRITEGIDNLEIITDDALAEEKAGREGDAKRSLSISRGQRDSLFDGVSFILADEAHWMDPDRFGRLCRIVRDNEQVCIFSSDPEQVLTALQRKNDIAGRIRELPGVEEFVLSERLRMNREMFDFIQYLRKPDRRPAERMSFDCVTVLGAYSTQEAQDMLEYYRMKGYVFLNYTAQDRATGPYAEYEEDFDPRHIFGQEFDRAVALMDDSFCYDAEGELAGVPIPDPDNLYPNLFYHAVTRVREQLVLIIVRAPGLLDRILSIFEGKSDETSADDVQ